MSDPERLLSHGEAGFELDLLRSARSDRPDPDAQARLLATLGLASGAAGLAAVAASATTSAAKAGTAAASAAGAASAASAATVAKATSTVILVKWIGAAMLAGGVAVTGAAAIRPAERAELAAAPRAHEVVLTRGREAMVALEAPRPSAPDARAEAPSIPPPATVASAAVAAPRVPAPAPEASALVGEIAVLDRARAALSSDDPRAALEALGDHQQRYASGALSPEATVLRIEALAASGRDAEAASLGARFLAEHPGSPHARRVRSVLARLADEP
jgi:TolA-binding protein